MILSLSFVSKLRDFNLRMKKKKKKKKKMKRRRKKRREQKFILFLAEHTVICALFLFIYVFSPVKP